MGRPIRQNASPSTQRPHPVRHHRRVARCVPIRPRLPPGTRSQARSARRRGRDRARAQTCRQPLAGSTPPSQAMMRAHVVPPRPSRSRRHRSISIRRRADNALRGGPIMGRRSTAGRAHSNLCARSFPDCLGNRARCGDAEKPRPRAGLSSDMTRAFSPCSDAPARLSSEKTIRPPKSLGLPEAAEGSRLVELMLPKKPSPPIPLAREQKLRPKRPRGPSSSRRVRWPAHRFLR